jgi:hypothetical protein
MLPAALEADLQLLSALSGRGEDIEQLLQAMFHDLKAAIPSAKGMSLTVRVSGQDVTVTTLDDDEISPIGASILFPLGPEEPENQNTCIVFYAATPGAFVDLAADLGWTTGLPPQTILLDQHLLLPVSGSAVTGLRELSTVNQAIGMLIERGYSPVSARIELERSAEELATTVSSAALVVIGSVRSGGPPAP